MTWPYNKLQAFDDDGNIVLDGWLDARKCQTDFDHEGMTIKFPLDAFADYHPEEVYELAGPIYQIVVEKDNDKSTIRHFAQLSRLKGDFALAEIFEKELEA